MENSTIRRIRVEISNHVLAKDRNRVVEGESLRVMVQIGENWANVADVSTFLHRSGFITRGTAVKCWLDGYQLQPNQDLSMIRDSDSIVVSDFNAAPPYQMKKAQALAPDFFGIFDLLSKQDFSGAKKILSKMKSFDQPSENCGSNESSVSAAANHGELPSTSSSSSSNHVDDASKDKEEAERVNVIKKIEITKGVVLAGHASKSTTSTSSDSSSSDSSSSDSSSSDDDNDAVAEAVKGDAKDMEEEEEEDAKVNVTKKAEVAKGVVLAGQASESTASTSSDSSSSDSDSSSDESSTDEAVGEDDDDEEEKEKEGGQEKKGDDDDEEKEKEIPKNISGFTEASRKQKRAYDDNGDDYGNDDDEYDGEEASFGRQWKKPYEVIACVGMAKNMPKSEVDQYPVVKGTYTPSEGDTFAFQMLSMDPATFLPVLSEYRYARVLVFSAKSSVLKVLTGTAPEHVKKQKSRPNKKAQQQPGERVEETLQLLDLSNVRLVSGPTRKAADDSKAAAREASDVMSMLAKKRNEMVSQATTSSEALLPANDGSFLDMFKAKATLKS